MARMSPCSNPVRKKEERVAACEIISSDYLIMALYNDYTHFDKSLAVVREVQERLGE